MDLLRVFYETSFLHIFLLNLSLANFLNQVEEHWVFLKCFGKQIIQLFLRFLIKWVKRDRVVKAFFCIIIVIAEVFSKQIIVCERPILTDVKLFDVYE